MKAVPPLFNTDMKTDQLCLGARLRQAAKKASAGIILQKHSPRRVSRVSY